MNKPLPTLPAYTRIKRVEAARVTGWMNGDNGRFLLSLEGGHVIEVTGRFMRRHKIQIGSVIVKDEEGVITAVNEDKFAAWYRPALPELEDLPSMRPQAQIVRQKFEVPLKPRPVIPTRTSMDMVLQRTAREDGE